jgi:hypothetical protein
MLLDARPRHNRGSKMCAHVFEFAVSHAGEGRAMATMPRFNFTKPEPTVIRLINRRHTNPIMIEQGDETTLAREGKWFGYLLAQVKLGCRFRGARAGSWLSSLRR